MKRWTMAGLVLWAASGWLLGCVPVDPNQACLDSGGTVATALCCETTFDFPNSCVVGACGCAPEFSHEVLFCDCGEDACFDGRECVAELEP